MLTLIVEDDQLTSMLFTSFLIGFGKCEVAENGAKGFERFQEAHENNLPYDLLCLDLMMPDVNGIDLLKMIRKREDEMALPAENRCKVVMTTAVSERSIIKKAYEANCDSYLIKPIKRNDLIKTIRELGLVE